MLNSALLQPLITELGEDWTDPDQTDVFLAWLNDAIAEMRAAGPWSFDTSNFALAVTAGIAEYDIPSSVGDIRAIEEVSTGRQLQLSSLDRIRMHASLVESGTPDSWFPMGYDDENEATAIRLHPVPDADSAFTVYGRRRASSTLLETDEFPFPLDFVRLVRERLRAAYYDSQSADDPRAARAGARFQRGLAELRAKYQSPEADLRSFKEADPSGYDWPGPSFPANIG